MLTIFVNNAFIPKETAQTVLLTVWAVSNRFGLETADC